MNSSSGGDEATWLQSQMDISSLISLYKLDYEDHVSVSPPLTQDDLVMSMYGGKLLDLKNVSLQTVHCNCHVIDTNRERKQKVIVS